MTKRSSKDLIPGAGKIDFPLLTSMLVNHPTLTIKKSTDDVMEGEILDPVPVITNSALTQYIQENLAERIAMKKVIEHGPVDSELENSSDVDWESLIEVDSIGSMNNSNELFIGKPQTFLSEEMQQKLQGGFKSNEMIIISDIDTVRDIPMRVSKLADDMVVLVNNHLVDPTAVHRIGLGDIVHIEKDIKANDKVLLKYQTFGGESPRLFQSKIDSTRGKVGAAVARRRKKAIRKLHKRKH